MQLIVHATDGSPEAEGALDMAIDLAKETGAKLAVVTVHVPPPGGKVPAPPIKEVEKPQGAEHIAEAAAAKARAAGVDAKAYVTHGLDPAPEIARVAEELGADLLVVGSRGLGAVRGALMGSVSRYLVSHSKVPVTVVTNRHVREHAHA
jgi:nucleotide-binding universal stress UspA family protein